MITVLKDSYPVARKEHKCMLCGHIIKPGEKYHRKTLVYDDKPYDWIMDMDCDTVFNFVVDVMRFNGYDEEYIDEDNFNDEIWQIITDELNISKNDAFNLTHHERVMIVKEHLPELKKTLEKEKHEYYEYQKKLQYFNNMRYRHQHGELNADEITQYKKEYEEWILAR